MRALVLDTATPAVTAGVVDVTSAGVEVRAARVTVDARAAGELLAPHIAAVLAESGTARDALAAVVAGVGPGPYTSLRVGLVTAAAFGQARGIPTYAVDTLDALGHAAAGLADRVLVATDARRREVYWATYAGGRRLTGPGVAAPAAVAAALLEAGFTAFGSAASAGSGGSAASPGSAASGGSFGSGGFLGPGGSGGSLGSGGSTGLKASGGSAASPGSLEPATSFGTVGCVAVGEGAHRYADVLGLPVAELRYPGVAALAALAADRVLAGAPGETLTPRYLRRPDAVAPTGRKTVRR